MMINTVIYQIRDEQIVDYQTANCNKFPDRKIPTTLRAIAYCVPIQGIVLKICYTLNSDYIAFREHDE